MDKENNHECKKRSSHRLGIGSNYYLENLLGSSHLQIQYEYSKVSRLQNRNKYNYHTQLKAIFNRSKP